MILNTVRSFIIRVQLQGKFFITPLQWARVTTLPMKSETLSHSLVVKQKMMPLRNSTHTS